MLDDFMRSSKEDIEFLLEQYKILIYDGNFDIICNHSGVLDLINDLDWSGASDYK
jgi:vitellogenic carboxypeptidase-like protein